MNEAPFRPTNGRVLVRELPYKPSRLIQVVDCDRAVINEGIVVALSDHKFARRKIKGGWEMTGTTLPHDVSIGDRVIFPGKYVQDDVIELNRVRHRVLDAWEIQGIVDAPQPEGWEDPLSGELRPDTFPIFLQQPR